MNNIDALFQKRQAEARALEPEPTGTPEEVRAELIRRCEARDKNLEQVALEAEREGDSEGCWFAMASRAHNKRFWEKLLSLSNPK